MPELPEVETTRRGIAPLVVGRRVAAVRVYDRRLRWSVPSSLSKLVAGRTIDAIDRRSKYLLFRFSEDTLLLHFGMTGSLTAYASPPPRRKHDHVDIVLESGITLRYHDPRRFGAILWVPPPVAAHALLAKLGPEPFDPACDAAYLHRATRGRTAAIKLVLMNNHFIVGVGNIYASEALFRARIRPTTPANRLSKPRLERLLRAVRDTLEEAIAKGGSTLRDYVNGFGESGGFQHEHLVYGREGLPCGVCGAVIRQIRQGGRATTYCPRCQR